MMKRLIGILIPALLAAGGCSFNNPLQKSMDLTAPPSPATNGGSVLPADFDIRFDGVWIIGGTNSSGMVSNLDRYNPYTDTWESNVTTLMTPVRNFAAAAYSNKIYVFGGIGVNNLVTNLVQIYDVLSDTWTRGTNMPTVRQGHGAVTYANRIYIFGGSTTTLAGGALQTVYQYHPTVSTNPWSASLGNLVYTSTRMDFGYTMFDGEILYAGGRTTSGAVNNTVSAIIPLGMTYQWTTGVLKVSRLGVCGASYSTPTYKYAFFIGGSTVSDTEQFPTPTITASDNVCVYFPYSEQGIRVVLAGPRLIQARAYAQACVKGDSLFVFGGLANATTFLDSVERLNVVSLFSQSWQTRSPMPVPRAGFCAVSLR